MPQSIQTTVVQNGVGLGTVIAVVISWHRNHSVLWAIFHGICSWFYVIYFALTEGKVGSGDGTRSGPLVIFAVLAIIAFLAFFLIAQALKQ